ncbi:thioredoxin [Archaeoglobus sulfaticallidus PM70-1]|uniref:Thioredoxin n=1 Tax=Archaeoglobus sulfaticallidus PM70-1 TaxID=387631 RepID=N0BKH4_9EURY|nr:thioredoxin [Archaeoglobus sulfaticallidus]AGK60690.1 thioredoxin [Archaeoglobus sulfaticallidus PM70-1]
MKNLNEENFYDEIKKKKLVVVDFWAEWCMPCRMLTPILEKVEKEYDGKVEFAKVNTDENPALASRFGIFSIPTVLMFYDGEIVNAFVGALPEGAVKHEIEKALKKVSA